MAKDRRFAEYNQDGYKARHFDTVAVKLAEKKIINAPRTTERAALDNAAYGDKGETQSVENIILALLETGRYEICTKCGGIFPADNEHFRTDNSKLRNWTQPCLNCHRKLSRRGMALNRAHGMWRKTGKFNKLK